MYLKFLDRQFWRPRSLYDYWIKTPIAKNLSCKGKKVLIDDDDGFADFEHDGWIRTRPSTAHAIFNDCRLEMVRDRVTPSTIPALLLFRGTAILRRQLGPTPAIFQKSYNCLKFARIVLGSSKLFIFLACVVLSLSDLK